MTSDLPEKQRNSGQAAARAAPVLCLTLRSSLPIIAAMKTLFKADSGGADARRLTNRKALFVGDINVDVIMGGMVSAPEIDREILCSDFDVVMGSSAVICACALASLGGRAAFSGLAGRDEYGDFMMRGLRSFGIDTSRVQRTDKVKTGVTVNLIYRRTRSQVTYPGTIAAFDGAGVSPDVLRGVRHVHFAGPYQQEKFRPHIARLLRQARARGVSTSLDPQWDITERWERMREWLPLLTWLFVNEDEARSISGAKTAEQACARLAGKTACPVVKAGKRGAWICLRGKPRLLPTYPARVKDTTGAGDSFAAGFLYATLNKGWPPEAAADFANAVGARCCQFTGGVAARSSERDIVRLMRTRSKK